MLKAETSSKAVTPGQVKFLRLLHDECDPMTVKEMASALGKSVQYAHQTVRELLDGGMVEKTFEGIDASTQKYLSWKYKLSVPIESIAIRTRRIRTRRIPHKISDDEVRYAAILRNGGMTGRELQDRFRAMYPNRSKKSLLVNVIPRARLYGWCR